MEEDSIAHAPDHGGISPIRAVPLGCSEDDRSSIGTSDLLALLNEVFDGGDLPLSPSEMLRYEQVCTPPRPATPRPPLTLMRGGGEIPTGKKRVRRRRTAAFSPGFRMSKKRVMRQPEFLTYG